MIAAAGDADEPLPCPTCGALVGDVSRHAAWHRGRAPLATPPVQASELAELIDEAVFQLRRTRREGVL